MEDPAAQSGEEVSERERSRRGSSFAHVDVRVLAPAAAPAAAAALARGFDQEPAKLALLPDPATRRLVVELGARNRLYDALRHGSAHGALVDGALAAVALWHPPGVAKISVRGAARATFVSLGRIPSVASAVPRVAGVVVNDASGFVALLRMRRRAVAHATRGLTWCLALLATVPEHRGRGLARSLLERQLRRCDEDSAAAWLETVNPVNPPIYERFGFETIAHLDGPAWLPGLWVMRREPQRR